MKRVLEPAFQGSSNISHQQRRNKRGNPKVQALCLPMSFY
jgi:hypothetical protein